VKKRVKLIVVWCCIVISGIQVMANEKKEENYLRYVNEITRDFVTEMEKETGLGCIGSGGSMPHDVEEIEVIFVGYRRATLEEARALTVLAIQKLLKKINAHEKIRPFLREYPFTESRVGIEISFQNDQARYYLDGSVAFAFNSRNRIVYNKAEKRLIKYGPTYDAETGGIYSPAYEKEEERLVKLTEESYEEATKIVAPVLSSQPLKKI
jgi:hypothetical protein